MLTFKRKQFNSISNSCLLICHTEHNQQDSLSSRQKSQFLFMYHFLLYIIITVSKVTKQTGWLIVFWWKVKCSCAACWRSYLGRPFVPSFANFFLHTTVTVNSLCRFKWNCTAISMVWHSFKVVQIVWCAAYIAKTSRQLLIFNQKT